MYKNYCLICGKTFESNSKYADVCSASCRSKKNEMPWKVNYSQTKELDEQSESKNKSKNKVKAKTKVPIKFSPEMLQKMSWEEKYNSVDTMTKVSMLSKALSEINITYSYGELRILYDSNKSKYEELELKVMEIKR